MTTRPVLAQRGSALRCRGWRQEALLRMLENVLEVGQQPEDLIVYASLAKAARSWESYDAIRAALIDLRDDETLVIQSGKPIARFPTSPSSPVVIMANNNMVGRFATSEVFYERAGAGQTVWGGLTAGAWQYIGSQGVLQGVYETLMSVARQNFDGSLEGRLVLTSGLGGMGSAQPLAIRLAGGIGLIVEVDLQRLAARAQEGSIDEIAIDIDDALNHVSKARDEGRPFVVGLHANAADVYAELVRRDVTPDVATDMTAAHDARYGYVPQGLGVDEWKKRRDTAPDEIITRAQASMRVQVESMLTMQARGSVAFENGNNLRVQATTAGLENAFDIDGFAEAYIRPLFCQGIGPFRWVALSGDVEDLKKLDDLAAALFAERSEVGQWIELVRDTVAVQGLPARSCWLGHGERSRFALAVNALVKNREISAPVLFSRDHLDAAGMTHPFIGTEGMRDGSDAVSDWPLLDAMLLCSTGADLVAVHGGGGGYSGLMQSAGVSFVADGSPAAAQRLSMGLDADTGLGVSRYAEAGYESAIEHARIHDIKRTPVAPEEN